jgi:CRISPR-associated protein Cas4
MDPPPDPQPALPLDAPPLAAGTPLVPARMVNELVYCPRLAYLEWVQGEWADNADTVDGRRVHQRGERPRGLPPPAAEAADDGDELDAALRPVHALELSSERLGLIARIDLAEFRPLPDGRGWQAVPVETKRGKRPHVARGAYEPVCVQLAVQALLLEEQGYTVPEGQIVYAASRERVRVEIDAELRAAALQAAAELRLLAMGGHIPPPLDNSPKCPRCSLVGICLPDEVHFLRHQRTPPRPLAVAGTAPALPLYVQARGAKVARSGELLEISVDDASVAKARLGEVSQLVLQGGVYLTSPALHELMARGIPVTWMSAGGWFLGHTQGVGHKNVELRTAQYRASFDASHCLRLARGLVAAKIRNQRTLLRRNWKQGSMPEALLADFRHDIDAAERARDLPQLLGIEGAAAARYFAHFACMLSAAAGTGGTAPSSPAAAVADLAADDDDGAPSPPDAFGQAPARADQPAAAPREGEAWPSTPAPEAGGTPPSASPPPPHQQPPPLLLLQFDFTRRSRRPPADPVNALLSYAYALLVRSMAVTLTAVGFDAYRGFYHQPRYGRPALALDLMEPFRPLIADSAVLMAINNGEIALHDFTRAGGAVALNEKGRRAFIATFERRLSQTVTHPLFGYAAEYRQVLELQARLLGRHLLGEIDDYPNFVTR